MLVSIFVMVFLQDPGLYPRQMDGKWGYVNAKDDFVIIPQYGEVRPFKNGLAIVGFPPQEEPKFDGEQLSPYGRYGLIDTAGKEVMRVIYQELYREKGYFIFGEADENWRLWLGVADSTGQILIEAEYSYLEVVEEGMFQVRKAGESFRINRSGKRIEH